MKQFKRVHSIAQRRPGAAAAGPEPLRIGSLCSGYGGLDMAVKSLIGGELAWVADNDPRAAAVLTHRFPTVPNLGDLTTTDWSAVPPVDVMLGGFPCVDLSYAGRGAGIQKGNRSGLWYTIADAIGVLRPRLVVLENVAAIVGRRPGLDVVLGDLARLGFDARWTCLRASDVGAPHGRKRWFAICWPAADTRGERRDGRESLRGDGWPAAIGEQAGSDRRDSSSTPAQDPDRPVGGQWGLAASGQAAGGGSRADTGRRGGAPAPDPDGRRGDRLHERVEPGYLEADPERCSAGLRPRTSPGEARGAAVTPAPDADSDGRPWGPERDSEPQDGRPGHERRWVDPRGRVLDWGIYEPAIRRWETILGRPAPRPTELRRSGERLSPRLPEWMMGLPEGWVTDVPGLTVNDQLHVIGNGVVPQQAAAALKVLLPALERAA